MTPSRRETIKKIKAEIKRREAKINAMCSPFWMGEVRGLELALEIIKREGK